MGLLNFGRLGLQLGVRASAPAACQ